MSFATNETSAVAPGPGVSRRTVAVIVSLLFAIQTALLVHSAKVHSPTWDEVGHLAAGLSHWELGRFELYSVNPPLIRTIAAAPVALFCDCKMDWDYYRSDPALRSEVFLGRRMVDLNGQNTLNYFFVARLAVIPIALMGGWFCFLWGRDLFGASAGMIALALWTFSPDVLAYGSLITPDLSSAVALIGSSYLFWRWLKEPNWSGVALITLALAYAMLTKSVWLLLPVAFAVTWAIKVCLIRQPQHEMPLGLQAVQLAIASVLALVVVNGFYGFRGSFEPLGEFRFVSSRFNGVAVTAQPVDCIDCDPVASEATGNRFANSLLASLPVPLPANYLQGIDVQTRDFERGRYDAGWQSYLMGRWQQGGWWYYYFVGLLVKIPVSIWVLLGISTVTGLFWRPSKPVLAGVACLWVPAIAFLLVVSASTGLNRYVRYALPVVPILFIWASQIGRFIDFGTAGQRNFARAATAICCVWLGVVSAYNTPHHLSYFNEIAGGPEHGHEFLCDSNIDWGQDLILLQRWLEDNPDASKSLNLAYFGAFDPKSIEIEYQLPPPLPKDADKLLVDAQRWVGPSPGWHVVSKNFLVGHSMPIPSGNRSLVFQFFERGVYEYFSEIEPTATIGQSMLVYHLTLDQANQLRKSHNLVQLQHRQPDQGLRKVDSATFGSTNPSVPKKYGT